MLRSGCRVIALVAIVTSSSSSTAALAADTTLTLACQGTVTETVMEKEAKPEPISMGIIANFTNRTVQGFEDFPPVKITGVNEVTVSFLGEKLGPSDVAIGTIEGSIDRVTGAVNAYYTLMNLKTTKITYSYATC